MTCSGDKRKVLFVIPSLKIGGIETALKNLVNNFDYTRYEVTIFVFNYDKNRLKDINDKVIVISGSKLLNIAAMTIPEAKRNGLLVFIVRIIIRILCKLLGADIVYKFIFSFEKKISGYDCVVSYSNNITTRGTYFGANKFVLTKTDAPLKIAWLHVDYEAMNMNNKINNIEYNQFNYIISVSNAVKEKFLKYNPSLKAKTRTIYNILHKNNIVSINNKNSAYSIVTVGRIDPNKNQIECVNIAKRLRDNNIDFIWYIVGDGQQREEVEELIKRNNLGDKIIITGYIDDVNEYLKRADLFVSTSLSESYGMAIVEAQMAGIPVVVKYYPAVSEIINGRNGIVVDSYDEMYEEISSLLLNRDKYISLKNNTTVLNNNMNNMNELYKIIDS